MHRSESGEVEFRIRRRGEVRHLRAALDPVATGACAAVHGVIQDITGRRRAERIMSESRSQLLEVREQAAEERHMSVALREAIMPGLGATIDLPHARIAVRYVAAGAQAGRAATGTTPSPCPTAGWCWPSATCPGTACRRSPGWPSSGTRWWASR